MRKPTMKDVVAESRSICNQNLWERAGIASRIAKIPNLTTKSRRVSYAVKDAALTQAVQRGGALVRNDVQMDGHALLSIRNDRKRLHAPMRLLRRINNGAQNA